MRCLSIWFALLLMLAGVTGSAFGEPSRASQHDEESETADHDIAREREYMQNWVGGEIDGARLREMWNQVQSSRSEPAAGTATQAVNSWQLVGPLYSVNTGGGNMTGRVRDIDPINMRVLAASGGLWRFNFGPIAMCDSVPSTFFGAFATQPSDPNTILLGTGEFGVQSGTGLYKTTNNGVTWVPKPMNPSPGAFTRIRYSPSGTVVHAATSSGYYRSTDGGETWTNTLAGVASDVAIVSADANLVYVTLSNDGLYRSLDAGLTWSKLAITGAPTNLVGHGTVTAIKPIGNFSIVTIYLAFETSFWRSTDSGVTWTSITPPYTIGVSGYGPVISVCPSDPLTVLYGNVGYSRTADGGATWTKIASPHLHADYHVFAWEADGIAVWAGNDGGWFRSPDRGLTWESGSNVMPISQFYTIDCERTVVGGMIGGTQDNNVLYTPNQALFWSDPALGSTEGDAFGVAIDQYFPNRLFAIAGVSGGPYSFPRYRSVNYGATWAQSNNGIDPTNAPGYIRTDNAFPLRLVMSAGGQVYESLDSALTWTKSNPTPFPTSITNLTSSTRVNPSAVLYATVGGTTPGQRLYVRDGGVWSERSSGLPAGSVWKVVPHPFAGNPADIAWAIVNSTAGWKIYRTDNRGLSWINVSGDMPITLPISDLVVNPRNSNQLYIGTYFGCYRTKNGGVNWERWNNGLPPTVRVSEMTYLDLNPPSGQFFIVVATYGRSVFKRDISGDDPQPAITAGNAVVTEGAAGQTTIMIPLTLSAPAQSPVMVNYTTVDGSATTADGDYVADAGTVTFLAGHTSAIVYVTVNGDSRIEPDESFSLSLSNPIRATVASTGSATIQDDDFHTLVRSSLYITDGTVSAVTTSGNTLYIGGTFNKVGPATGSGVPLDATTGLASWLPLVAGTVYAICPDGSGGWYLGGAFTHVGGIPRGNLAHVMADHSLAPWNPVANDTVFALAEGNGLVFAGGRFTTIGPYTRNHIAAIYGLDGTAVTGWNPGADARVLALLVRGSTLYVGGDFKSVGGQSRDHLATIASLYGTVLPWNPSANATVTTLAQSGSTLYASGWFTILGGQTRNRIGAVDVTSGLATAWAPTPTGTVNAIALNGTTVYLGGSFANISDQPRANLAAVDSASGAVTAWAPNPELPVSALAVNGSSLYVAGSFTTIGGQPRNHLGAVSLATGLATAWNPDPTGNVMALSSSAGTVFAGGDFITLAAVTRRSIAALDLSTGAVTAWNPAASIGSSVFALAASGGLIYAGGSFNNIGAQPRNRIAALDPVTGFATTWNPNANGPVRALLPFGSTMIAGGTFTNIGGQPRNNIAALSLGGGNATGWNPNANTEVRALATDGALIYAGGQFGNIGAQPRARIAALNPTTAAATSWNPALNGTVNALLISGGQAYVGGDFTTVGVSARQHFAIVNNTTGLATTWSPDPDATVSALALEASGSLYVGGAFTTIGGLQRPRLALLSPAANTVSGWTPNPNADVTALALNGTSLYAGGNFVRIGGLPMAHLAGIYQASIVDAPRTTPGAEVSLHLSPNPTSGGVHLRYSLPVATHVSIALYDVLGRRLAQPADGVEAAGGHELSWDGMAGDRRAAPGLYFVRLEAGGRVLTQRLVIIR